MIFTISKLKKKLDEDFPENSISENFIRKLLKTGKVSYLKSGNRFLVKYAEIINFLGLNEIKEGKTYENRL